MESGGPPPASAFPNPWVNASSNPDSGISVSGPVVRLDDLPDYMYSTQGNQMMIEYGEKMVPMSTLTPTQILCGSCCPCCIGPLCSDTRKERYKSNSLTFIGLLAWIQLIMFLVEIGVGCAISTCFASPSDNPSFGPPGQVFLLLGAKWVPFIKEGQVWRFLTPILLHGGILHLAFNLFAQIRIGLFVQKTWGQRNIAIIYLLSGLGGTILSCLISPDSLGVGASGALMGLIGAWITHIICTWHSTDPRIRKMMFYQLIFAALFTFLLGSSEYIDNAAHFGGFLVGGLVALGLFAPLMRSGQKVELFKWAGIIGTFVYFAVTFTIFYTTDYSEL